MQFLKMTKAVLISVSALAAGHAVAESPSDRGVAAKLYKNPDCYCCELYAEYLDSNGYEVEVIATDSLPTIKQDLGVPSQLTACHTSVVGGYVLEGHVPVSSVNRLLQEQPQVKGIGVQGMPAGSPGMGGKKTSPLIVYSFDDSEAPQVYETH